jgi:hypothetical protein
MAPLPPDSTTRYKFFYNVCNHDHVAQIRAGEGVTDAEVADEFNSFISAAGALFNVSVLTEVQKAASGSDIFNPVVADWPVGWGTETGPDDETANYCDWIGRSLDGRRVRFGLFGATFDAISGKYRVFAADNTTVNDACSVLNGAEGVFVSINGFQPVWKLYINTGNNAHWRNKIR